MYYLQYYEEKNQKILITKKVNEWFTIKIKSIFIKYFLILITYIMSFIRINYNTFKKRYAVNISNYSKYMRYIDYVLKLT